MKYIYQIFTCIGFVISVLAVLGMLGVGHFNLIYSDKNYICEKKG